MASGKLQNLIFPTLLFLVFTYLLSKIPGCLMSAETVILLKKNLSPALGKYPRGVFFLILFIYLFIYGCVGSSFLCEGFLQLRQAGATLHRGARASHYHGLSCCGAQAPDAQAQ